MANEKHIFIGIGGSGCQTVAQIKEKVYEKRFHEATATKSRLQAMNDSYRFIFLDTDQRDIDEANKRNRETFEQGKVPFISPQTDLINLGRANPQAIYYEAKQDTNTLINKRILEACSQELASMIPDQPLAFGAGAFRMKSRIAFAHSLTDFQSKVQSAISALNDVNTVGGEDCIIYYWVVGSTLGGTGSGIFNDVLYHLNQIHHQVVGNGDPQLVLTMYMPKVYIDSNSTEEKYTLNAYGVFTELEAFKKMSFEQKQNTVMHRLAFHNDYNLINSSKRYCPFYYLIPIDIQTDKGTSLGTTRTMYRNTAELLFHLHNGKAGATFRSDIDNYMNDIMERNHKNFLVPMGYVSLQKPQEQFANYMRFRFKRDVLRSWLLCDNTKEATVEESKLKDLEDKLFLHLDATKTGSIAFSIKNTNAYKNLMVALDSQDQASEKLSEDLDLDSILGSLKEVTKRIENESCTPDKREEYISFIREGIWSAAEGMIREHGLSYTYNAIEAVRKNMAESLNEKKENVEEEDELNKLYEEAVKPGDSQSALAKVPIANKYTSNRQDIDNYIEALRNRVNTSIDKAIHNWALDLKRVFVEDEKTCELTKLAKLIASYKDKAAEMNREAVKQYNNLALKFGDTVMDVTTVYLPMLKEICDGNGWKQENFFSRLYSSAVVKALPDKEETPERKELMDLLDFNIYNATNEKFKEAIDRGQYRIFAPKFNPDPKKKKDDKLEDVRFFCNVNSQDKPTEKVIEDFLNIAVDALDKKLRESKVIQEKWENKKISAFFADLTNEQKDDVRRSLNPALFFSYNNSRIEVTKKEEHVVFVADTDDLAAEMLGYQKGNPKHRFEKSDSENVSLVIKSKYGLSLEDYRIYDAIKMVYDKATFREKYHFHRDFAQYKDELTIDMLPLDVLAQHRTFAKILLMNKFQDVMKPFYYEDEYNPEDYTTSMFIEENSYFNIARPEAFGLSRNGKLMFKLKDNNRCLYEEIDGEDFTAQFDKYCDLYYNLRFGETVNNLIQESLLQQTVVGKEDGKKDTFYGDRIMKENYPKIRKELLDELAGKIKDTNKPSVKKLYTVLFEIIRNEYDTVHNFIKSK